MCHGIATLQTSPRRASALVCSKWKPNQVGGAYLGLPAGGSALRPYRSCRGCVAGASPVLRPGGIVAPAAPAPRQRGGARSVKVTALARAYVPHASPSAPSSGRALLSGVNRGVHRGVDPVQRCQLLRLFRAARLWAARLAVLSSPGYTASSDSRALPGGISR